MSLQCTHQLDRKACEQCKEYDKNIFKVHIVCTLLTIIKNLKTNCMHNICLKHMYKRMKLLCKQRNFNMKYFYISTRIIFQEILQKFLKKIGVCILYILHITLIEKCIYCIIYCHVTKHDILNSVHNYRMRQDRTLHGAETVSGLWAC